MRPLALALALLVALAAAACVTYEYRSTVERYAERLPDRARRAYKDLPPDLLERLVLEDAKLGCLVDRDRGRSAARSPSAACKCAEGNGPWVPRCGDWMMR